MRIVSLAPSATSILWTLGARRHVVGVSKWCAAVAPVGRLPRVGDCWAAEPAEIARLHPTLLIGSVPFKAEMVTRLLELGAPLVALNPRSLADVYEDIRLLGSLTRRAAAAERVVRAMQSALARIALRAKRRNGPQRGSGHPPRVYCEAWPNPRITSPPWVAELVRLAGGEPVLPAGTKVTEEQVAAAAPEVMVLAWTATGDRADAGRAMENPAWREVPAVRLGQVHVVRDELLNTPAPILVRGASELFRLIHRAWRGEGAASSAPTSAAGGVPTPATSSTPTTAASSAPTGAGCGPVVVVAAVMEQEGRILICQRRRGDRFELLWEFPGGKVQPGESAEQGLARELREELGIEARVGREIHRTRHRYEQLDRELELIFYSAAPGNARMENLAFEQIVWAERGRLTEYDFLPADRELVERLARGNENREKRKSKSENG